MQNNTFFGHNSPRNVIVLEQISSTNDYAKQLLSKFTPQANLTAIMAKHQSDGRGQRGAQWITSPNQNLTVSIIYSTQDFLISDQFLLTISSSLAVYDTVKKYTKQKVDIKWPNDIYVNDKKIAGILIENKIAGEQIKHCIFGIGINVFQTNFQEEIAQKTTSIKLENSEFNVTFLDLIKELQRNIEYYLKQAKKSPSSTLALYNEKIFRKNVPSKFVFNNNTVWGVIKFVSQDGLLHIDIDNQTHKVDLKGITYII